MKKILIWDNFPLYNIGGPSGYLYNLREYLILHPNPQIFFLSEIEKTSSRCVSKEQTDIVSCMHNKYIKYIVDRINQITNYLYYQHVPGTKEVFVDVEVLNQYDFIHFHLALQIVEFKKRFPGYVGKTILTSHSPCPCIDEMIQEGRALRKLRSIALKMECRNYRLADYLMFPCKEAREPYEKDVLIKKVFQSKEQSFIYVPSAIVDVKIDREKIQTLESIGIPSNSFVIAFFGRHNNLKGYDILKLIGTKLLEIPHLYFLCGGNGDIQPPVHERWIELGFVKNAQELLLQSDLYILPNRETYFDLVVLEVLRSSTMVLLSDNGGNRFFKSLPKNETKGIDYFNIDDIDDVVNKVKQLVKKKENDKVGYQRAGNDNRTLFLNRFMLDTYVRNYTKAINSL